MHKRDTGKRLLAVFVMLPLFFACSAPAFADNYDVTAKVPAPLPAGVVPVVESPGNNSVATGPMVQITGTCTIVVPTLIVVLLRGDETVGSGACSPQGTFSIMIRLVLGVNTIRVKFMTITGESSGWGTPLVLIYSGLSDAATNQSDTHIQDSSLQSTLMPLALLFDYDFVTYSIATPTSVTIGANGGQPPYTFTVFWGDSSVKKYSVKGPDSFIVTHQYLSVSSSIAKLLVRVQDAKGAVVQGERALVSFEKPGTVAQKSPASGRNYQPIAIWMIASVGTLLLVTLRYRHLFELKSLFKAKKLVKKRVRK